MFFPLSYLSFLVSLLSLLSFSLSPIPCVPMPSSSRGSQTHLLIQLGVLGSTVNSSSESNNRAEPRHQTGFKHYELKAEHSFVALLLKGLKLK